MEVLVLHLRMLCMAFNVWHVYEHLIIMFLTVHSHGSQMQMVLKCNHGTVGLWISNFARILS